MGKKIGQRMKLSDDLAAIIGKDKASRAQAVKLCWAYVKEHNLQDGGFFTPDEKMAKVFGTDKTRYLGMSKFLAGHLTKLD